MRKGYLLVEILVVLAVIAMVGGIFDRFWGTFAFDLPRDSRLIQENITLCNAVSHIQTDVASAKTLSQVGVDSNEPNTLLVELPNGMVSYKFSNGRILRSFTRGTTGITAGDMVWLVPHGWIEFPENAFAYRDIRCATSRGPVRFKPPVNQQARQMDDFADCILSGRASPVPGELGRRDIRILSAIYEAAATRQRVLV